MNTSLSLKNVIYSWRPGDVANRKWHRNRNANLARAEETRRPSQLPLLPQDSCTRIPSVKNNSEEREQIKAVIKFSLVKNNNDYGKM